MKIPFASIIGALILLSASGCVHLPNFEEPKVTAPAITTVEQSPSTAAIQKAVNGYAVLFSLGGLASLALGGFLIYGGKIVPGIKLVAVGLLLPIFGIWFSFHWLLVVIIALLASAGFFLAAHYAFIQPILDKLENFASKIEEKIAEKI